MKLNDKIKGAIYGMALGDALGIGTEFMTRAEIKHHYPDGLRNFDQFIRDVHRSQFKRGEWSNDTEVILQMLDSLLELKKVDTAHMAHKLKNWYKNEPKDIVAVYRIVMPTSGWEDNPIVEAHNSWRDKHYEDASNEALNRALISGIMADGKVTNLTTRLVHMTHDDSRCVAATIMPAIIVRDLIYRDKESDFEWMEEVCRNIDERVLEFLYMARDGKLEDFDLDNPDTVWYARKSMGAALWAYWHCNSPEEVLMTLVDAGGDSDTNASLAMILAGLKYGYDALPDIKNEILNRERLDDIANRLTAFIEEYRMK